MFYVEVTNTFGGEANYCWLLRFKVKAKTKRGAVVKVSKELGYQGLIRKRFDCGDMSRHDVYGNNVCLFVYDGTDMLNNTDRYTEL
jgi:hypothetical protein